MIRLVLQRECPITGRRTFDTERADQVLPRNRGVFVVTQLNGSQVMLTFPWSVVAVVMDDERLVPDTEPPTKPEKPGKKKA